MPREIHTLRGRVAIKKRERKKKVHNRKENSHQFAAHVRSLANLRNGPDGLSPLVTFTDW